MENKNHNQDDYLSFKSYLNKPPSTTHKGFSSFEQDGDFYFALLDTAGNVFLRSEGYSSAKARENGMESVNKNKILKERWSIAEMHKKFFLCLKAGNHQEIAKSGAYNSKGDAEAALAAFMSGKATFAGSSSSSGITGKSAGVAASGLAAGKIISETRGKAVEKSRKVIGEKRGEGIVKSRGDAVEKSRSVVGEKRNVLSETKSKVKEDDYLKCEAYKGHKITDTKNRIAKFKGEDGQFYFAAYYKDGSVRLRSEGFKTEAGREDELKQCIAHMEDEKRYSTIKKGSYFINVLKDKTGREVGRSCMSKEVQETVAYVAPVVATVAPVVHKAVKVEAVKPPPPPKVVPIAPPVVEEAAGAGCLRFWPLLLLLLIPLLWFLMKGCGATPPPPPPPPPPPVVVEKTPPPPPPAPVCNCEDLTNAMFNIPSGPAPKTLTKLGVAPEYGNCHGLDADGFLNKLNTGFNSSGREKRFLNAIAEQLGFEGGWNDVTAGDIESVRVPRGVSGNMGTLRSHETVYRKLDPTNARDLEAFRINGKNACNLHFMKTCGNHFFFQKCE